MVRLYGKRPYGIVPVHGGPGAIGSLKGFSDELSRVSKLGTVDTVGNNRMRPRVSVGGAE